MRALKASVSSESIEVPEYQPLTDWQFDQQLQRRNLHRGRGADDEEGAIDAEAAEGGGHGFADGDGGQDGFRAAHLEELGGRILRLAVDVGRGAELFGERGFVLAAGDGDGLVAHARGVLHAEMAEAAEAEDRDEVARAGAAVAEGVEGGEAGAEDRGGFGGGELGGDLRDRGGGGDHVFGVAAVEGEAGDLLGDAGEEIAAAAVDRSGRSSRRSNRRRRAGRGPSRQRRCRWRR